MDNTLEELKEQRKKQPSFSVSQLWTDPVGRVGMRALQLLLIGTVVGLVVLALLNLTIPRCDPLATEVRRAPGDKERPNPIAIFQQEEQHHQQQDEAREKRARRADRRHRAGPKFR